MGASFSNVMAFEWLGSKFFVKEGSKAIYVKLSKPTFFRGYNAVDEDGRMVKIDTKEKCREVFFSLSAS